MATPPLQSRVLSRPLLCAMECIYSEVSVECPEQSWWSHSVPLKNNRFPAFKKHTYFEVKASSLFSLLLLSTPWLPPLKFSFSVNPYPPVASLGTVLDLFSHPTSNITSSLLLLSTLPLAAILSPFLTVTWVRSGHNASIGPPSIQSCPIPILCYTQSSQTVLPKQKLDCGFFNALNLFCSSWLTFGSSPHLLALIPFTPSQGLSSNTLIWLGRLSWFVRVLPPSSLLTIFLYSMSHLQSHEGTLLLFHPVLWPMYVRFPPAGASFHPILRFIASPCTLSLNGFHLCFWPQPIYQFLQEASPALEAELGLTWWAGWHLVFTPN